MPGVLGPLTGGVLPGPPPAVSPPQPLPAAPLAPSSEPGPSEGLQAQAARLGLIRPDDTSFVRQAIFDRVRSQTSQLPAVSNSRHRLRLANIDYEGPERYDLRQQKEAVLRGQTLGRKLKGDLELVEALPEGAPEGTPEKLLDRRRLTLARVPYLTERGTFILGGTEYTLAHQMRLRPGVFTRIKDDGEVEAHVNVLPGQGRSHRLLLEPQTGVFHMQLGTTKVPLFSVLKALGVNDRTLSSRLGNSLYAANAKADDSASLDKLAGALLRQPAQEALAQAQDSDGRTKVKEDRRRQALESLLSSKLDPEVTRRTLGTPWDRITPDVYLGAVDKILKVHQGLADPDDRDHLAYQRLLGPEDLFGERVNLSGRLLRQTLYRASAVGNLQKALPGLFSRNLEAVLTSSGLANPLEEVNPADNLDQQTRVSRMGYGAISSTESVPTQSRSVQPSHLSYLDILRTPESMRVGVDVRLATAARRGPDGRIYAPYKDTQGRLSYRTPQELADKVVAFPKELDSKEEHVAALDKGRPGYVHRSQVHYSVPEMEDTFNHLSNLVPLKSAAKGQRVMMGGRMLTQALPLEGAEAPLVQSGVPWSNNRSYEEEYGDRMGAVFAQAPGLVHKVTPDGITVRHQDGTTKHYETYNWHPLNRKTSLHNTSQVEAGQPVRRGELLARSNFTDKSGAVALGMNLRTAYMPARGYSFEDANVISESAAKRLSSLHLYQHELPHEDDVKTGKHHFVGLFPGHFQKAQLDTLDDQGVVKVGQTVAQDDPLILASRRQPVRYGQVSRSKTASFTPQPLTWDHEDPGVVTDVEKTRRGTVVTVRTTKPMREGDKLSGRMGDKGVIGKIIPDEQMPKDEEGRPLEVLFNPLGVVTRVNPSQILETVLGKIAAQRGKPYKVKDFGDIPDLTEWVHQEAVKHGVKDKEDLLDPQTGRKVPGVLTGVRFFMKLHHTSASKSQGRATGGYSSDDTPARGGSAGTGSKKMALMDLNAILSHGALDVIADKSVRGQKNLDYWAALLAGKSPPPPKVPLVHQKFFAGLQAAGIRVKKDGPRLQVLAMTDKDTDTLAGERELENAETVDWKHGLKPVPGGLFDETLTGGHGGNRFSKITLHEPMPSPVMEEPIRRVLGLTQAQFRDVLAGKEELQGKRGPEALHSALDKIDLETAVPQALERSRAGSASSKDQANRRLFFLKHAQALGIHPREWMVKSVPVLPPAFRPVSVMSFTGKPLVADPNYLYRELFTANQNLKALSGKVADTGEERLALYDSFKGVTGLGEPIVPKNGDRAVKGILHEIFGESSKHGMVQQKLLAGTVDTVGRAVITPDPDLDMDSVGLPEGKSWEIYKPFVIRRLVRRGVTPVAAAAMVKDQTPLAASLLQEELQSRPVIMTRAPVLHRYGVMAFWPRLTKGDTLRVSPLVTKGFNADHDGNCLLYPSKVGLEVDWQTVYDSLGEDERVPWEEFKMRLTGSSKVVLERAGSRHEIEIGSFPRTGRPVKDRNGADVYRVPAGVRVLTYDLASGQLVYAPATHFTVEDDHRCARVTTRHGRQVTVSDNESLAVFDASTNELVKVTPQEAVGKMVPFVRCQGPGGDSHDFDTGWWYGALAADGWVQQYMVGYAKNDDRKRTEFVRLAVQLFGPIFSCNEYHEKKSEQKFADSSKVHLCGRELAEAVARLPVYSTDGEEGGRGALRKTLPTALLDGGSRDCLLGIFSGLLDGDAMLRWSPSKKKPQFDARVHTSSPALRDSICRLGRLLGVRIGVTTTPARRTSQESYVLVPFLADLHRIAGQLRLVGQEAAGLLAQFAAGPAPKDDRDIVPVPRALADALSHRALPVNKSLYVILRKAVAVGHLGRASARTALALVPEDQQATFAAWAALVANEDVHWDLFAAQEPAGNHQVFDLAVPQTKVFVTDDGLVVYDTCNFHVPVGDDAVQDAIDKMLPSRNLLAARHFKVHQQPLNEFVTGLYQATGGHPPPGRDGEKAREGPGHVFRTEREAIRAFRRGEVDARSKVTILEDSPAQDR